MSLIWKETKQQLNDSSLFCVKETWEKFETTITHCHSNKISQKIKLGASLNSKSVSWQLDLKTQFQWLWWICTHNMITRRDWQLNHGPQFSNQMHDHNLIFLPYLCYPLIITPPGGLTLSGCHIVLAYWQSTLVLHRRLSCKLVLCRLQYWL